MTATSPFLWTAAASIWWLQFLGVLSFMINSYTISDKLIAGRTTHFTVCVQKWMRHALANHPWTWKEGCDWSHLHTQSSNWLCFSQRHWNLNDLTDIQANCKCAKQSTCISNILSKCTRPACIAEDADSWSWGKTKLFGLKWILTKHGVNLEGRPAKTSEWARMAQA